MPRSRIPSTSVRRMLTQVHILILYHTSFLTFDSFWIWLILNFHFRALLLGQFSIHGVGDEAIWETLGKEWVRGFHKAEGNPRSRIQR